MGSVKPPFRCGSHHGGRCASPASQPGDGGGPSASTKSVERASSQRTAELLVLVIRAAV